jgi:hypothetical protein
MVQKAGLKRNSVLFWLVAVIGVGIIFVGTRFLVAPLVAAAGFGVPADGMPTMAYLWAKGTRDIVSGLLLFVLLAMNVSRLVIAAFIMVAALIPFADFVNVYLDAGSSNASALMIHGGTAAFMLVLAALLWQRG